MHGIRSLRKCVPRDLEEEVVWSEMSLRDPPVLSPPEYPYRHRYSMCVCIGETPESKLPLEMYLTL